MPPAWWLPVPELAANTGPMTWSTSTPPVASLRHLTDADGDGFSAVEDGERHRCRLDAEDVCNENDRLSGGDSCYATTACESFPETFGSPLLDNPVWLR